VTTSFSRDDLLLAASPIVRQPRTVRFQDVDAAGTIYFVRVLEYFGDAYLEVLLQAGLDVPALLRERTLAAPLAHVEADYLEPLFFGDEVHAEVVAARVGTSSVTFGHRLKTRSGEVAAIGETVHVFVDGKTFRPMPVPGPLRRFLDERADRPAS
jgi:YbgC/YbaW family acyl-CoA thioester hydrolase